MMVDKRFGQAGARIVIEELLVGREASFFVLSDGTRAIPLGSAEDHKRALDGDAGPNTGGMGAYAPSSLFDAATAGARDERDRAARARGHAQRGKRVPRLPVRRPDADCGRTESHRVQRPVRRSGSAGDSADDRRRSVDAPDERGRRRAASAARAAIDAEPRVGVVLASGGYPDTYETGKVIHGLDAAEALPGVNVFHSGTAKRGSDIVTAGGRVLTVVASGSDYRNAIDRAYDAVGKISFEGMHYRKDIGAKALV